MSDSVSTQTFRLPRLTFAIVCLALVAALPVIQSHFPNYIAGYLIQVPALAIGYFYVNKCELLARYKAWQLRALLLISFVIPLQNTFVLKATRKYLMDGTITLEVFRPAIFILLFVAASSIPSRSRRKLPKLVTASFVTGLIGWLLSTAGSNYPAVSFGSGIFEFFCPFAAIYALSVNAPDRSFLLHCLKLFIIAFALVAGAQASVILASNCCDTVFKLPLLADEFLELKKNLPLMQIAGGNGYGNTDNFVSLWTLVVPVIAGLYYRRKDLIWALALFMTIYAGLLVYSRSGILAVVCGLVALFVYRAVTVRSVSLLPAIAVGLLALIHMPSGGVRYFSEGMYGFFDALHYAALSDSGSLNARVAVGRMESGSLDAEAFIKRMKDRKSYDASGVDRMEAMRRGVEIASHHPVTGIGYGVYKIDEPDLTAPHNMFLLRFAEGGIFSAISLLFLAAFTITGGWRQMFNATSNIINIAATIGLGCFLLKGVIFGATFSIGGQISWGYGAAILVAILSLPPNDQEITHDRI